ncbi:RNase H family protein [Buchnera aphidicola]|uniref:ribonuclease H n=1 Tax=Buchnera aphidicola (Aphis nerii) TaxID=1241835 RepID=A0A4D6Y2J5_9GAMM|nr:RNase H family protein [Buchnera aphidicola]QCI18795.1 ribonuclease HI [Buchnera aphidicola (Aphis nerii)]
MELMAIVYGLESLKQPCIVEVFTDSNYVKQGVTKWIYQWKKKKWKTVNKKSVKNIDLWLRINNLLEKHVIKWFWIKAHIGHVENELCDKIARKSAKNPLMYDLFYEKIFFDKLKRK